MIDLEPSYNHGPTKASIENHPDFDKWKKETLYRIKRVEFIVITILLGQLITTLSTVFSKSDFEERIMSKVHEHSTEVVLTELDKASKSIQTHKAQPFSDSQIHPVTHSGKTEYHKINKETKSYTPVFYQAPEKNYKEYNLKQVPITNVDHLTPSRKLQLEENFTTCNGTSFFLQLRLDDWPAETSWKLIDNETSLVVANKSYTTDDKWLIYNFTKCLKPGSYIFSLSDSFGDGIRCDGFKDGLGCHAIFLNNELVIEGPKFFGNLLNHSFDSTQTYCMANAMFLVEVHLQANISNSDWHLRNDASNEIVKLELIPEMSTNSSEFYFSCLSPAIYTFSTSDVNRTTSSCEMFNECYSVLVDEKPLFQKRNFTEISMYSFSVTQYGRINERNCHYLPILSPSNWVKDFQYDERTEKIMNNIFAVSPSDSLHRYDSFQYKAACWIIFDDELQIDAEDEFLVERYVLAAFIYAVNQNAELLLSNNTCDFSEVSCNAKGHITKIDISKNFFGGTIPIELSQLRYLETLKLSHNDLKGTIPPELGSLFNLQSLWLDHNDLSATIPSQIGNLFNLKDLFLRRNKLEGFLPSEIGNCKRLESFTISSNNITSTIPLELMNCTKLINLWFYDNGLTGTIPANIHQLQDLEKMWFYENELSGPIPSGIGHLLSLKDVRLFDNKLNGQLPEQFGNLDSLAVFFVQDNFLNGTLPSIFKNLTKSQSLNMLDLSRNNFSGSIPYSLWDMTSLVFLDLQDNDLTGEVPDDFCNNNIDFRMDETTWFLDETKVNCTCCDTPTSCYIWNITDNPEEGTMRPLCPSANIFNSTFYNISSIVDVVTNTKLFYQFGDGFSNQNICLSPLGCYKIDYQLDLIKPNTEKSAVESFNLSYSTLENSSIQQDQCDAVEVCGVSFDSTHPHRKFLNHIAQVTMQNLDFLNDSSSSTYEALCWIMTEDPILDRFDICDGTLLQRYVLALFFFSQSSDIEFNSFASNHTCEWKNIICDSSNKFVQQISFPNSNLTGNIITEIGLLTRLQTINLTGNKLDGTLDPIMFHHFPDLVSFDVSKNRLRGMIPKELFKLPKLKDVNLASNKLIGSLPQDIVYTKSLESFDVSENLLQGNLPNALLDCPELETIVMTHNEFVGSIPTEVGKLKNLKKAMFNRNRLVGSIPKEIFDASQIEVLMLQSNSLTGIIPTQVGNLENATYILLNHNSLKGSIPQTINNLKKIQYLHLHNNQLTGRAPEMIFASKDRHNFITDCGDPSYLLEKELECESCTICCNSEGVCQNKHTWKIKMSTLCILFTIAVPILITICAFSIHHVPIFSYFKDVRDPVNLYKDDSVYCFILSSNPKAWIVYTITAGIQIGLLATFFDASSNSNKFSDNSFPFICPHNEMKCEPKNDNSVAKTGWLLFFLVMTIHLGSDLVLSALQIRKAVKLRDMQLFLSGCGMLCLTILTIIASFIYNVAYVEQNADLVINAVILLFINDLDEKAMSAFTLMLPGWTGKRLYEIRDKMNRKKTLSVIMSERSEPNSRKNPHIIDRNYDISMNESAESIKLDHDTATNPKDIIFPEWTNRQLDEIEKKENKKNTLSDIQHSTK